MKDLEMIFVHQPPPDFILQEEVFMKSNSEGSISFLDFPGGSVGTESAFNARDPGSIPGSGTSSGEGNDYAH